MEQALYIFFGWVLGILSHFLFYRTERKHKIQDFKTGFLEELKVALPDLAMVRFIIQNSMGELDRETVKWVQDAISTGKKDLLDSQMIEGFEKLKNLSNDEVQMVSKLKKSDPTKGKGFKHYHLPFLDTNINIVPLLDIEV